MNLILIEPGELAASGDVRVTGARARHIVEVLRATEGGSVRVGLIEGAPGTATVRKIGGDEVRLHCIFERETPPRPRVDLLLALPRPKVMRRLWAQLSALGVGRILLTNADKVERHYFDTHWLAPETYRPLLIEGLQQARDTRLPEVTIHRQFRVLIEDQLGAPAAGEVRVIADPGAHDPMREVLKARLEAASVNDHGSVARPRLLIAIGPEGGWNEFERQLLAGHGFHPVSMGARTLRSDTACVALLALAHEALV